MALSLSAFSAKFRASFAIALASLALLTNWAVNSRNKFIQKKVARKPIG